MFLYPVIVIMFEKIMPAGNTWAINVNSSQHYITDNIRLSHVSIPTLSHSFYIPFRYRIANATRNHFRGKTQEDSKELQQERTMKKAHASPSLSPKRCDFENLAHKRALFERRAFGYNKRGGWSSI